MLIPSGRTASRPCPTFTHGLLAWRVGGRRVPSAASSAVMSTGFTRWWRKPACSRPPAVGFLAVAGDRDQTDAAEARKGAQVRRQLVAVHHRQADVEEGDVRRELGRDAAARSARRARRARRSPCCASASASSSAPIFVVVDDQDARRASMRRLRSLRPTPRVDCEASPPAPRGRQPDDELAALARARRCAPTPCRRAARPGCARSSGRCPARPASARAPAAPARTDRRCAAACPAAMPMPVSRTDSTARRHRPAAPAPRSRRRRRVLRGVGQQVRDDLAETREVAVDAQAASRHVDVEPCASAARAAGSPSRSPCATTSAMLDDLAS